eukprot:COSAG05_NODE_17558_length_323_cov_0.901786_1_plen_39_part_01
MPQSAGGRQAYSLHLQVDGGRAVPVVDIRQLRVESLPVV